MNPLVSAFATRLSDTHARIRRAIEDFDSVALNWCPGKETNSPFVIVTHMLGSERFYLNKALNRTIERDRSSEFVTTGETAAPLLQRIDAVEAEMRAILGGMQETDLAAEVEFRGTQRTVASILVDMVSHLSEHVAHLELTRQLWQQHQNA